MSHDPHITVIKYQGGSPWPAAADSEPPPHVPPQARHCLVFRSANALGWQVFPPFDATVTWRGGTDFEVDTGDELGERLWMELMAQLTGWPSPWCCSKLEGILQIDPGMTFRTAAGSKLLLTAPINRPAMGFWTQSGILDSDWFWVPSTINLQFVQTGLPVRLSRSEPIAQLVVLDRGLTRAREYIAHTLEDEPDVLPMWRRYMREKYGEPTTWEVDRDRPRVTRPGAYPRWKASAERSLYRRPNQSEDSDR